LAASSSLAGTGVIPKPGGVLATLAIFLPSFLIVIGLAPHLDRLNESPYFRKAACGILCSFVGLLLTVTIRFAAAVPWDWGHAMLAGAAFAALMLRVNIVWVVLAGIFVSLLLLYRQFGGARTRPFATPQFSLPKIRLVLRASVTTVPTSAFAQ
jgi:chromate transporter